MAVTGHKTEGLFSLSWHTDEFGVHRYILTEIESDGQYGIVATFEQGPFDTALEVAQWAWKALAVRVPPARC